MREDLSSHIKISEFKIQKYDDDQYIIYYEVGNRQIVRSLNEEQFIKKYKNTRKLWGTLH